MRVGKVLWSVALAGGIGFAASLPANADPVWVSNVAVPSGYYNVGMSDGSVVYYGGEIDFTATPGTQNNPTGPQQVLNVWCDDLYNDVGIGSQDQYYTADPNTYLAPVPGGSNTINEIAGLAWIGDNNLGNVNVDAAVQFAIWDLMYGITPANNGQNTLLLQEMHLVLQDALAGYTDMVAAGYMLEQLESPCDPNDVGDITYNDCQIQGQVVIVPNTNGNNTGPNCIPGVNCNNVIPEPGALALVGTALLGFGAWGRRRVRKAR